MPEQWGITNTGWVNAIRGKIVANWESILCGTGWLVLFAASMQMFLFASVSGIATTGCGLEGARCHEGWFWLVPALLVAGPLIANAGVCVLMLRRIKAGGRFWYLPFSGLGVIVISAIAAFGVMGVVINY